MEARVAKVARTEALKMIRMPFHRKILLLLTGQKNSLVDATMNVCHGVSSSMNNRTWSTELITQTCKKVSPPIVLTVHSRYLLEIVSRIKVVTKPEQLIGSTTIQISSMTIIIIKITMIIMVLLRNLHLILKNLRSKTMPKN